MIDKGTSKGSSRGGFGSGGCIEDDTCEGDLSAIDDNRAEKGFTAVRDGRDVEDDASFGCCP